MIDVGEREKFDDGIPGSFESGVVAVTDNHDDLVGEHLGPIVGKLGKHGRAVRARNH